MDKPWKVILAFVGVFVAGAVFGGFFSLGMGWQVLARHTPSTTPTLSAPVVPPAATTMTTPAVATTNGTTTVTSKKGAAASAGLPVPQAMQAAQLIRRLADRLGLTPAQRERIMPLIQRASDDFRRQQANYFREDAFILQRLQLDIAKELTPEQRVRLEELQQRQREVIRKRQAELQALQKANTTTGTPSAAPAAGSGTASTAPSVTSGFPSTSSGATSGSGAAPATSSATPSTGAP